MTECLECKAAETNSRRHTFNSGCISCRCRMISNSPVFFASELTHRISPQYRAQLEAVNHPQGFLAAHREAVAWRRRLDGLSQSAPFADGQDTPPMTVRG